MRREALSEIGAFVAAVAAVVGNAAAGKDRFRLQAKTLKNRRHGSPSPAEAI
jgi:hypothetical protein